MKDHIRRRALAFEAEIGTDSVVLAGGAQAVSDVTVSSPNSETAPAAGAADLAGFEREICECQKCALGATRNRFVFGVGNPDADVLFIGEAPGADEDLQGEPFVGRAGKLLDKILAAIEFDRSQVYIANILKCRPPKNRDPQPDERDLCMPYLERQIALIKPRFICCLGRIAAQRILETKTPLGKLRHQWFDRFGARLMVTYHPAALLRFAEYKRETWEDVQRLRKAYDDWKKGES
jgi:uracil-DNA glycosylase family 4